jgi:SAGA-associated factor 73
MASTNGARKGTKSQHVSGTHHTDTNPAPSGSKHDSSNRFKYTKLGLVDPARYDSVFTEEDRKPVKLKIKNPLPKQSNPGNWSEENVVTGARTKKVKDVKSPNSALMKPLDDKIAAAFPSGKPFDDVQETVLCKHCKQAVLRHAAASHIKDCLKKKQEKLQKKKEAKEAKDAALRKEKNGGVSPAPSIDEAADPKRARKTALDISDGVAKKSGKKRKADDEPKGASAKKKKKEDTKAKAAKAKGPVNVEMQCGVLLNNGAMCARSLTCKSHSMGAKRSVPGRSMPYDVLLAQYQKKNQAKQQRTSFQLSRSKFC